MLTHKRGGEHPASDWGLLRETISVSGLNPHVGTMADPSDDSQQGSSPSAGRLENQDYIDFKQKKKGSEGVSCKSCMETFDTTVSRQFGPPSRIYEKR